MNRFLKKIGWFILPCVLIIISIVYLDFFKVFFQYDEYYSEDLFVSLNREYVCLKKIDQIAESNKPNSFVFGSSRSQAFKCKDWNQYIGEKSKSFHFDAANEALIGVLGKLEYLQKNEIEINNALVIIDIGLLKQTSFKKRNSSLTISHPKISTNSMVDFYSPFISASLNPKFVISYLDYKTFRTHRGYMGQYIANTKYPNRINEIDMDIFYGKDILIEEDSVAYYEKTIKSGIFYDRSSIHVDTSKLEKNVKEQLIKIKNIFDKNNTQYEIVISPMYDQIEINKEYLKLLNEIFGLEKIHDFSGINDYTIPLGNYYEKSHYRPHVAREIMKKVYLD